MLITELTKYGELRFYQCGDESGKIVKRNYYKINSDFYDDTSCISIQQDNTKLRNFLNLCAGCFDEGINPVFDKIKN